MATYFVDGAVGDDGNAGTSEGAGNAWATIQKALDTVAAGDDVNVKASATYSEALTLMTAGSFDSPIILRGYTTTTGDGGIVTNDGGGSLGAGLSPLSGNNNYLIHNFRFTDFTGVGCGDAFGDSMVFVNCRSDNNGTHGFQGDGFCQYVQCTSDNNGSRGFDLDILCMVFACASISNGLVGIFIDSGLVGHSLFFDNGIDLGFQNGQCVGNIVDGNNENVVTGIRFGTTAGHWLCANNLVHDCQEGIKDLGSPTEVRKIVVNNLISECSTDYVNVLPILGNLEDTATFVDEANNDYTPGSTSPALAAGLHWSNAPAVPAQSGTDPNIGVSQEDLSGGGGGGGGSIPTANKRAGKQ